MLLLGFLDNNSNTLTLTLKICYVVFFPTYKVCIEIYSTMNSFLPFGIVVSSVELDNQYYIIF